ncbi:MAG TPA: hypothetical protein VMU93_05555 [Caulobacteraceae bacterium]|nr:hypothetical protein [Caulobacteraceae bacterium]
MNDLSGVRTHFILAYSGCDEDVGEAALSSGGPNGLVASNNGYDWLGTGIYFWESDPARAYQWAEEAKIRHQKRFERDRTPIRVRRPFVVGAVINLLNCLDLTTTEGVNLVREGHMAFEASVRELQAANPAIDMPSNTADEDMKGRYLDFQVINYTCQEYAKKNKKPIDTVRGVFTEGKAVYAGAGFREKTHTQISVREPNRAILGYFRVPKP